VTVRAVDDAVAARTSATLGDHGDEEVGDSPRLRRRR
jgi:hypothetical protein